MDNRPKLSKEFLHFITAKFFYTIGYRMVTTIVIYQVFHISSTYMVGIAGITEFIPAVLTALYAGHYIDNHDKKKILIFAYACYFICATGLGIASMNRFHLSDSSVLSVILMTVFCTGIIRSFASPAANAMIAAVVPRSQLQRAIAINSSTFLSSSISGHALGGMMIAFAGISNAYLLAALFMASGFLFGTRLKPKPPIRKDVKESRIQSIKYGFKFVWTNKTLLGVISLDLFAVLFGGAVAFIPEIASTVLHTGALGYGFLNAAMDIGSLTSILLLLTHPMRNKQGLKMMIAVAGFGLCIIVFGLSKVYWLSFLALATAGFCDGISVVVRGTIAQLYTPDELRGRVSSINMIFVNSSNELGQFESGITSRLMGTVPAVIFGGAMSVLVAAGTFFKFKGLRKIEY